MEKIIIKFCNLLDRFASFMDSIMFPKPKRKKKKCKSCHCDCHCTLINKIYVPVRVANVRGRRCLY